MLSVRKLKLILWVSLVISLLSLIFCTVQLIRLRGTTFRRSDDVKQFLPRHNVKTTERAPIQKSSMPFPTVPAVDIDQLSSDELTVVTAFFDIGTFQKGAGGPTMKPTVYRRWMSIFANIENPLVAYFDQPSDVDLMRLYRRRLPANMTRVILVDRRRMVSFERFQPLIQRLFDRPGYPNHPPNTVNADYSSAMHAKYELIVRTIADNPFDTRYYCWVDVGLFRDLVPSRHAKAAAADSLLLRIFDEDVENDTRTSIRLRLPVSFDPSRVAYTQVSEPKSYAWLPTAESIVREEFVWVCGCFFVGRADRMARWGVEYLHGVQRMLDEGWMSTDQQVLYWLFHGTGRQFKRVTTNIQTYSQPSDTTSRYNNWFYLGYLSKEAGETRSVTNSSVLLSRRQRKRVRRSRQPR